MISEKGFQYHSKEKITNEEIELDLQKNKTKIREFLKWIYEENPKEKKKFWGEIKNISILKSCANKISAETLKEHIFDWIDILNQNKNLTYRHQFPLEQREIWFYMETSEQREKELEVKIIKLRYKFYLEIFQNT